MLVVVEDWNISLFLELSFNLEASRSGDVLKVNSAEASAKQSNGVYKFVNILGADAERESVNSAELLEQNAFTLHNGHTCLRSDVAETENSRAVRNNGNKV